MRQRDIKRRSDDWKDLYRKDRYEDDDLQRGMELPHGPILFYNEVVADHSTNPRNVGRMTDADGFADIGDPSCGDSMQLWIKVDKGRISDIKFLSSGCAGAVATSSMTTVLAKGKTVEEAKRINDRHVILSLKGVPSHDGKCILSGTMALLEAIKDYERKKTSDKDSAS